MPKSWVIVGICGATNGGKTTLSSFLRSSFPGSVVMDNDTFFRPDDSEHHVIVPELNHKNWDTLSAVDWDAMMESLSGVLESQPESDDSLLIVEGHLIFNYPKLERLFHRKYFLMLDREECYRRRKTRVYDPPDVPGYFERVVWPMYLSNLEEVKRNCTDVVYLDGSDSVSCLQEAVLLDLKAFLKSYKDKNSLS